MSALVGVQCDVEGCPAQLVETSSGAGGWTRAVARIRIEAGDAGWRFDRWRGDLCPDHSEGGE